MDENGRYVNYMVWTRMVIVLYRVIILNIYSAIFRMASEHNDEVLNHILCSDLASCSTRVVLLIDLIDLLID